MENRSPYLHINSVGGYSLPYELSLKLYPKPVELWGRIILGLSCAPEDKYLEDTDFLGLIFGAKLIDIFL